MKNKIQGAAMSKDEMKQVQGGNVQLTGCYAYCQGYDFMDIQPPPQMIPVEDCSWAASACFGQTLIRCLCFSGPFQGD